MKSSTAATGIINPGQTVTSRLRRSAAANPTGRAAASLRSDFARLALQNARTGDYYCSTRKFGPFCRMVRGLHHSRVSLPRCRSDASGDASRVLSSHREGLTMLQWALMFLVVAIIAGVLGVGVVSGTAAYIAKALFVIFIVLFLISLVMGRRPPVV
jgi:uncharacterized membrane protein YtjA (UPF0391 family)